MKKIKLAAQICIYVMLAACSKDVKVNMDIPNATAYTKLYMPQAVNNPINSVVSISDKDTAFLYNAYLGGLSPANSDISVVFSVLPEMVTAYNLQNNTSYKIMPAGSYSLGSVNAVIPAGKQSTGALKLSIKTKGFINVFETYLLPVTLTQPSQTNQLNNDLVTTFYLFTGSYAQGQVPRDKAFSFGTNAGVLFSDFYGGDLIRVDPSNGNLLRYPVDANDHFGASKVIDTGWDIFNLVFFYGSNRLIGRRIDNGNIGSFNIDNNNNYGVVREVGQGWGIFTKIIPYKGLLLGIDAAENMTMYPLDASGNFDYGRIRTISTGWNIFTQIIPYQNSLLAIESDGTMWQYPLSEDGVFGPRTKVGTGWNMYGLVIASGTDLLGLDGNGDLWRYKFNPIGLWPL